MQLIRALFSLSLLVSIATGELIHVSALFRHGHRSPVWLVPSQNFTVSNTWLDGLGQLTNIGKQNEFELGQFLRKRYNTFLGPRYNSSLHYTRSTDVDRTLMSAQSCLAGLFPPLGDQSWNPQLPWQPIPVHTLPQSQDSLLASPDFPCPERDRQFALAKSDPAYLALYAPHAGFLRNLSSGAGCPVTHDTVHNLLDTLWINRVANLTPPAWLAPVDWPRLVTVGSYQWRQYSWTPDLVRFGSGRLLDEILSVFEDLAKGHPPPRGSNLRLYSDHDTTVSSTLTALGQPDFVWPNFAACLLFEMHAAAGGGHSVRILYRNDTSMQPLSVTLDNCTDPCPLADVIRLLGPMRVTQGQLDSRCLGEVPPFPPPGVLDPRVSLAAFVGCFLLTAAALVAVLICCCRRRGGDHRSALVYRSLVDEPSDG